MLMIYGHLMPLRMLEEIRFWKMKEKEHAAMIRELYPLLEPEYAHLMGQWESVFGHMENEAGQMVRTILHQNKKSDRAQHDSVNALLNMAIHQSQEWIRHLYLLMERSPQILQNRNAPSIMNHLMNESRYFLGVFNAMLRSESALAADATVASIDHFDDSEWRSDGNTIEARPVPIGGHRLPPLPYDYDALEPYIDETTMRLHHQKHHASYVKGLNEAEKMMRTARETNDFALLKHWEREAAFNGAGHYLHTIFWYNMSPDGGGKPSGEIARQIEQDFGQFERFKQHFSAAAEKVEGGGWAILVWSLRSHRLEILQAEKHQNLSQWDVIPLLVLDVWEHAYYLKYMNERRKYIDAWWNVVNWQNVNERFQAARQLKWTPY